jgi:hypothetical protein
MQTLSPARAWRRLLALSCVSKELYQAHKNSEFAISQVGRLQDDFGHDFSLNNATHWINDLSGAFITTHPNYRSPAGADSRFASALVGYLGALYHSMYL